LFLNLQLYIILKDKCFTFASEFSVFNWLTLRHSENHANVEQGLVDQLMEETGLAAYARDPQCNISTDANPNGWTSGKPTLSC